MSVIINVNDHASNNAKLLQNNYEKVFEVTTKIHNKHC